MGETLEVGGHRPVAAHRLDAGRVDSGDAAVERGDVVAASHGLGHEGAPEEDGATDHQDAHGCDSPTPQILPGTGFTYGRTVAPVTAFQVIREVTIILE
jgi:hypothetical protein